ncbi:MAG: OmpH family outer membrane protein [Succiniclasticum sp.]|jgi:Skp family chaperone for outer membrane proteins|nr:OmpH family outer membrane protein [Succiniclasticum sp.]
MVKELAMAAVLTLSTFSVTGTALAATGVVDVNAVLQQSTDFQNAGKKVAAEQQKLQERFAKESASLTNKDKQALAEKLNRQLAEFEQKTMTPVQQKLHAAVEKAAKAKKIDTVVVSGALLLGPVDTDLTEDVKANMK